MKSIIVEEVVFIDILLSGYYKEHQRILEHVYQKLCDDFNNVKFLEDKNTISLDNLLIRLSNNGFNIFDKNNYKEMYFNDFSALYRFLVEYFYGELV